MAGEECCVCLDDLNGKSSQGGCLPSRPACLKDGKGRRGVESKSESVCVCV